MSAAPAAQAARPARDHLRRRQLAVRGRRRGRAARAAAWCCFRCAAAADPRRVEQLPHHWMRVGQFGRSCGSRARKAAATSCSSASLVRPAFWQIAARSETLRCCRGSLRAFRGGDDHLLSGIGEDFRGAGLPLLGAHEVAPEILVPRGPARQRAPSRARPAPISRAASTICARSVRSMSARRWWSPASTCWRSRRPKAPTRCSRASPSCARDGRVARAAGHRRAGEGAEAGQDRRFDLAVDRPADDRGRRARRACRHRGRRRRDHRRRAGALAARLADRARPVRRRRCRRDRR